MVALPGLATGYTGASERYVVYGDVTDRPSAVSVFDTKTWVTRRYRLPTGCQMYGGRDGPPVAAGRSVLRCDGSHDVLMDVVSGTFREVEKAPGGHDWEGIGRSWLSTVGGCTASDVHTTACPIVRNLQTGEVRILPRSSTAYDLDSPDLRPMTRCTKALRTAPESGARSQSGRFAIFRMHPLTVGRCDGTHPVAIGDARAWTSSPSLLGGWLTYLRTGDCPRAAYAYRPASQRIYRWATPTVRGARCVDDAIHTKYAILVPLIASVDRTTSLEELTYRLVAARLPSA